jgi:hypothetical protein
VAGRKKINVKSTSLKPYVVRRHTCAKKNRPANFPPRPETGQLVLKDLAICRGPQGRRSWRRSRTRRSRGFRAKRPWWPPHRMCRRRSHALSFNRNGEGHLLSEKRPNLVTQAISFKKLWFLVGPKGPHTCGISWHPGGRGARARVPGLAGGASKPDFGALCYCEPRPGPGASQGQAAISYKLNARS